MTFRPHKLNKRYILIFGLLASLFLVGSLSFILSSGWYRCEKEMCGIWISEFHMHDSLWHIALAEVAFQTIPPQHPIFAGYPLTNYNYLFDLLLFGLNQLLHISPLQGYFHAMPVVGALSYVCAVWLVVSRVCSSVKMKLGVALFLLLGNSAAFIMTLWSNGTLVGSATRGFPLVLSIQPLTMFYNHQFALSLSCFLFLIYTLHLNEVSIFKKSIFLGLLFGLLLGLKVYAGIVAGVYISVFLTVQCMENRNRFKQIAFQLGVLGVVGMFVLFTMYGLGNVQGRRTFVYDPLAFIRSLIDDPAHLFVRNFALARTYLEAQGKFSPRLITLYAGGILAFYVINYGARLIAFGQLILMLRRKALPSPHHVALWVTIVFSSLIPLFFVQDGDWFNTMQFIYYGVFLSSFLAGEVIASMFTKRWIWAFLIVLMSIGIPYIDMFRYPFIKQDLLSQSFLETMSDLKELPLGIVAQIGQVSKDSRIPAFSGKPIYITDEPVLRNTQIPKEHIAMRRVSEIHTDSILSEKSISYIILDEASLTKQLMIELDTFSFRRVIHNGSYMVYQR